MRAERISDLMRRWELASMSWSSVADLNNPVCLMMPSTENIGLSNSRQNLTARDREGMRNIIGGRPDSAPVFARNANRVDGLQEVNSPSTNMPRHVLESITQSPTQSLKNTGSISISTDSPSSLHRFQEYNAKEYNANVAPMNPRVSRSSYDSRGGGAVNGEYVNQQALYREQYLQQTGIIAAQPQFASSHNNAPVVSNVLRNNPYVQQFQLANNSSPQHFASRKRGFNNTAQMTWPLNSKILRHEKRLIIKTQNSYSRRCSLFHLFSSTSESPSHSHRDLFSRQMSWLDLDTKMSLEKSHEELGRCF